MYKKLRKYFKYIYNKYIISILLLILMLVEFRKPSLYTNIYIHIYKLYIYIYIYMNRCWISQESHEYFFCGAKNI